jgi:hypothetical protein
LFPALTAMSYLPTLRKTSGGISSCVTMVTFRIISRQNQLWSHMHAINNYMLDVSVAQLTRGHDGRNFESYMVVGWILLTNTKEDIRWNFIVCNHGYI